MVWGTVMCKGLPYTSLGVAWEWPGKDEIRRQRKSSSKGMVIQINTPNSTKPRG